MKDLITKIELDFTTLEFHEHYVISRVKEDVLIEKHRLEKLEQVARKFYETKAFGYIADRKNHYSLDPLIYFRVSEIPKLVGMAIVVYHSHLKEATALFEKRFYDKPFQIFDDITSAEHWMEELVNK